MINYHHHYCQRRAEGDVWSVCGQGPSEYLKSPRPRRRRGIFRRVPGWFRGPSSGLVFYGPPLREYVAALGSGELLWDMQGWVYYEGMGKEEVLCTF